MAYPLLFRLLDFAEGPQVVVAPLRVAQVLAVAPARLGDVVVDDDGEAGVREGFGDGDEDVHAPFALEVGIGGEKVRGDQRVGEHELVAVGESDAVETH